METKDLVILNEEQQATIAELPKLFENYMTAHSEFQIRNFIINDLDFPTAASKYHQSVRELWSRYQNLVNLTYEYRKLNNEIKLHKIDIEEIELIVSLTVQKTLEKKRQRILADQEELEIQHKTLRLTALKKQASEVIREMKVFSDVVKKLDQFIPDKYKDESGMPNRELSEEEFWLSKQYLSEALHQGDWSKTPFGKILGLTEKEQPIKIKDELGRLVFMSKKQAKQLAERRQELLNG